MKKEKEKRLGQTILDRLKAFSEKIEAGTVLETMNVTKVTIDLCPTQYDAASVKSVRGMVGVSQPVFAKILAVSLSTVRSWEQGQSIPSGPAARLLDRIVDDPEEWKRWLTTKTTREKKRASRRA